MPELLDKLKETHNYLSGLYKELDDKLSPTLEDRQKDTILREFMMNIHLSAGFLSKALDKPSSVKAADIFLQEHITTPIP